MRETGASFHGHPLFAVCPMAADFRASFQTDSGIRIACRPQNGRRAETIADFVHCVGEIFFPCPFGKQIELCRFIIGQIRQRHVDPADFAVAVVMLLKQMHANGVHLRRDIRWRIQ